MSATRRISTASSLAHVLRDARFLQIVGQVVFAVIIAALFYGLLTSIFASLGQRNLSPNYSFLSSRAGFDIAESPAWYSADSTYWDAYRVGFMNTLRVVGVGLLLTTILGTFVGIGLLSSNWLVRNICAIYVELLRNTPLLVQLFIWYFIFILSLPPLQQSLAFPREGITVIPLRWFVYAALLILAVRWGRERFGRGEARASLPAVVLAVLLIGVELTGLAPAAALRFETYPAIYVNIRGFVFPELLPTARFVEWLALIGLGLVVIALLWSRLGRINENTGLPRPRTRYALLLLAAFVIGGWWLVGIEPAPASVPVVADDGTVTYLALEEARAQEVLTRDTEQLYSPEPLLILLPQRSNFRFETGTQVSPEYMALLLGLVTYTAAFIADIVAAGIRAVPHGQVEAARALGLSGGQVLQQVVMPQALRVIIPPLGNQYLNLAKNSSLAIAIAYADLFQVATTVMNQSGQAVTGMFLVMMTYLAMSLTIAAAMNWVNRRFQLVTR